MTSHDQWLDLAKRCAKATGLDCDLDIDIAQTAFPEIGPYVSRCAGDPPMFWHDPYRKEECPPFTSSLDAIVSLIEKTLPGYDLLVTKIAGNYEGNIGPEGSFKAHVGYGKSYALALCQAYCLARAEIAAPQPRDPEDKDTP